MFAEHTTCVTLSQDLHMSLDFFLIYITKGVVPRYSEEEERDERCQKDSQAAQEL